MIQTDQSQRERERESIKDLWSLVEGALEFDEGGASGAWIDDEAQVGNGDWISGEMENWARWIGSVGQRRGTAMKMNP